LGENLWEKEPSKQPTWKLRVAKRKHYSERTTRRSLIRRIQKKNDARKVTKKYWKGDQVAGGKWSDERLR